MYKFKHKIVIEHNNDVIHINTAIGLNNSKYNNISLNELTISDLIFFHNLLNKCTKHINNIIIGNKNNKNNLNKHIWEGWRVIDFIDALEESIDNIMNNQSWTKPFDNKRELANYCKDNQPFYKQEIPEVVNYFADKYNIKN